MYLHLVGSNLLTTSFLADQKPAVELLHLGLKPRRVLIGILILTIISGYKWAVTFVVVYAINFTNKVTPIGLKGATNQHIGYFVDKELVNGRELRFRMVACFWVLFDFTSVVEAGQTVVSFAGLALDRVVENVFT
jgi:hypothetical protein